MKSSKRIEELKAMIKTAEKTYPNHYKEFFQALLDTEKRRIGAQNTNEYVQIIENFLKRRESS